MHRFDLTANCALSARQASLFFALVAGSSLVVAGVFVVQGFWPILPFAGLELGLLGWALRRNWMTAQNRERIDIGPEDIVLTRWFDAGERAETVRFSRAWTRARLSRHGRRTDLMIGQRGQWHAVGRFLVDEDKASLQQRLSEVLRQSEYSEDFSLERRN